MIIFLDMMDRQLETIECELASDDGIDAGVINDAIESFWVLDSRADWTPFWLGSRNQIIERLNALKQRVALSQPMPPPLQQPEQQLSLF